MASSVLTTIIAAGATAALVSGVTFTALKPDSGSKTQTEALAPTFDDGALTRVQSEVEVLRVENRDLRDRMVALEEAALRNPISLASERQPIQAEPSEEDLAARKELEQLVAALQDPNGGPPPPQFEATVAAALEGIREREDAEREAEREERRTQRRDERLEQLRTELGLDETQVNDMRDLYTNLETQMNTARQEARELGDFTGMREAMRTMRDESTTQLQGILSPSQYETYQESDLARGMMGGRGGRGGGNNGGGNNAGGGGNNGGGGRGGR